MKALYRCCLKWMEGNCTEAEDAFRAMLKAWEKVKAGADAIANFKAWVSGLTGKHRYLALFREGGKKD